MDNDNFFEDIFIVWGLFFAWFFFAIAVDNYYTSTLSLFLFYFALKLIKVAFVFYIDDQNQSIQIDKFDSICH